MREHLLNSNTLKETCYCGRDLTKNIWKSEFHGDKHYKTTTCECGANIVVEVDFHGSGHDNWTGIKTDEKEYAGLEMITNNMG